MQGDFCIGRWLIQPRLNTIVGSSKSTRVEPRVMQVLECLARHAGEVVSRETLIQEVWGDAFVTDHVLTRSIAELRKIFEDDVKEPRVIQTISKQGYRLVVPVTPVAKEIGAPPSRSISKWVTRILIPSLGLAALLLWAGPIRERLWDTPTSVPIQRFTISLAQHQSVRHNSRSVSFAISPRGDHLVYSAGPPGAEQLYLRSLDGFDPVAIPGTEGASNPFFSPDGGWVAFAAGGKLQKISLSGKDRLTICDLDPVFGMASGVWDQSGTIVFATRASLYRVTDSGGTPVPILLAKAEGTDRQWYGWPDILPGSEHVLFTRFRPLTAELAVISLDGGEPKTLLPNAYWGKYVPTGHLVFFRADRDRVPVSIRTLSDRPEQLFAVPFRVETLRVDDAPFSLAEGINRFACSHNGTLVYFTGGRLRYQLVWADRRGEIDPLPLPPGDYHHPVLSPDGNRIAVTVESDIWTYDLLTGNLNRMTFDGPSYWPIWTPDGERVIYVSRREPGLNLFWKRADGTGKEERLSTAPVIQSPMFCSPDGKSLVFMHGPDLFLLPLEGERKPRPLLATKAVEHGAALSPDGRWMAYHSDESGRFEVYVSDFPDLSGKWMVSREGGVEPFWSRDGNELFFRVGARMGSATTFKLMSAEVRLGSSFHRGSPKLLFEGTFRGGGRANYDVTPDGKRFLMVQPVERSSPPEFRVILNWFEQLRRPADR